MATDGLTFIELPPPSDNYALTADLRTRLEQLGDQLFDSWAVSVDTLPPQKCPLKRSLQRVSMANSRTVPFTFCLSHEI